MRLADLNASPLVHANERLRIGSEDAPRVRAQGLGLRTFRGAARVSLDSSASAASSAVSAEPRQRTGVTREGEHESRSLRGGDDAPDALADALADAVVEALEGARAPLASLALAGDGGEMLSVVMPKRSQRRSQSCVAGATSCQQTSDSRGRSALTNQGRSPATSSSPMILTEACVLVQCGRKGGEGGGRAAYSGASAPFGARAIARQWQSLRAQGAEAQK
eukprot:5427346-Pleurochrysis_carterae.AAC.1